MTQIKQDISTKHLQTQTFELSSHMLESLELLQLPYLELEQKISKEASENPLLEEINPIEEATSSSNINDDKEHILKLKSFASSLKNVEKIELLPYKTIGVHKYKMLNLRYRLEGVEELSEAKLKELNKYLK